MSCIRPIAPALEMMGLVSVDIVRPPLSACITARIQLCGTPIRFDACSIKGFHRPSNWPDDIWASLSNADCVTTFAAAFGGAATDFTILLGGADCARGAGAANIDAVATATMSAIFASGRARRKQARVRGRGAIIDARGWRPGRWRRNP